MAGRQLLRQERWALRASVSHYQGNTSNHLVKISQHFIHIRRSASDCATQFIQLHTEGFDPNLQQRLKLWWKQSWHRILDSLTFLFFNNGLASSTAGYSSSLTRTPSSWHLNISKINLSRGRKAFTLMKWYNYSFRPYLPTHRTDTSLTSLFLAFLQVAGWPFLKTTCVTCLVKVFETWAHTLEEINSPEYTRRPTCDCSLFSPELPFLAAAS